MSFRTSREAISALSEPFGTVLRCVTSAYVDVRSPAKQPTGSLALNLGIPVRLRAQLPIFLSARMFYRLEQHERLWQAGTSAYWYSLHDERHEILAYHWHPEQTPNTTFPHLHLEAGSGVQRDELTRAHLPTGGVTLAAFLHMVIRDFGVEPRRNDWHAVLTRHDTAFATTGETCA